MKLGQFLRLPRIHDHFQNALRTTAHITISRTNSARVRAERFHLHASRDRTEIDMEAGRAVGNRGIPLAGTFPVRFGTAVERAGHADGVGGGGGCVGEGKEGEEGEEEVGGGGCK
jgi:hypothetical protein